MTADLLLSRLEAVKRTAPDRYLARCPAHKDRRASLSIRELDDGRVLLHCFAGCDTEAVVGAVGVGMEELFPPRELADVGARREKRPFSVRELIDALAIELNVAWVILADLASGKDPSATDRKRAGTARNRCIAMLEELRNVR